MTTQLNDRVPNAADGNGVTRERAMAGDVEVTRIFFDIVGAGQLLGRIERVEAFGTCEQLLASGLCEPHWIPYAPKRKMDVWAAGAESIHIRRVKGGMFNLKHVSPSGPRKEAYDRLFDAPMPSRGPLRLVWSAPAELADSVFVEDAAYFERMLACFERSAAQCRENLALAKQRECRRTPLILVRNAPTSNVSGGNHDA